MTPSTDKFPQLIARLVLAVEQLSHDVEELGCTCNPEDWNKYHAPSRRRNDSRCTGVKLAVKFRGLCRRARRAVRPWPIARNLQEAIAALAEGQNLEGSR